MADVPDRAGLGRLYPIFLVDHDERWPALFQREKERLLGILGHDAVMRIEHFGSTAIPGIRAKPTIDVLISLETSVSIEDIHLRMTSEGYIRMVEQEDHVMFVRGYGPEGLEKESFHIHMYFEGDDRIDDSIAFRDHLRHNQSAALEYQALKEELALKYRNDREAYTEGKGEFVNRILKHVRC